METTITYLYNTDILDLTSSEAQIIAQQCNCVTKKAKGLSLSIKERYPHADFYSKRTTPSTPGTIKIRGGKGKRYVLAMFAQYQPGRPKTQEDKENRIGWFKKCLSKISNIKNLKSIAFPYKIGCGLAGGDWKMYKRCILEWALKNERIRVVIVRNTPKFDDYGFNKIFIDSVTSSCHLGEFYETLREEYYSKITPFTSAIVAKDVVIKKRESYFSPTLLEHTIKFIEMTGIWSDFLNPLINNGCIKKISDLLEKEVKNKINIYPPVQEVYTAFDLCDCPKVIIIGQDPYHTKGAAMGLAFGHHSTRNTIQPSLKNIYKELKSEGYACDMTSGDLTRWSFKQEVFLINTALTVQEGKANSHGSKVWGKFVEELFKFLNRSLENAVVIMWGKHAQSYSKFFNDKKFKKISSAHPSPYSARNGFFGSKPFSRANKYLKEMGMEEVDWNLC